MTTSPISPIDRLPLETLTEILILVPTEGILLAWKDPYPWKLALVCKFWRDAVFSTPQLWSNITIQLDPLRITKVDVRGEYLIRAWKLCLQRSYDYPLSVRVEATSEDTMPFVPFLMKGLVERVEQWETMNFGFPLDLLLPLLNPNLRYPRLRNLTMRGRGLMTFAEDYPHQAFFMNTPSLSRVGFHEFAYPPARLHFPWSQITDLTMFMNDGSVNDLLLILTDAPNLSNLTFAKFLESSSSVIPRLLAQTPLELPHLRKLSWTTYMFNNVPFFDSISAPRLSELAFQCDDDNYNITAIQRFLSRSKCRITSIRLNGPSAFNALSFLNILPDAEDVTLNSISGTDHLMRALTLDETTASCTIPNVKRLVIENMSIQEEMYGAFMAMVQSRLRGVPDADGATHRFKLGSLHISQQPERYSPDFSMAPAYEFLRQRLSSDELDLITYQERTFEDSGIS